ncbi:hypothetical protein IJF86_03485 [Candidatus Saccharibacteria bacterium]|nr:hypothetical protein [Candidatus Saccharibacteria bacterium]
MEIPRYWQKQEKPLFGEMVWNLPEQKQGSVAVLGGNAQSFSSVNRAAGVLSNKFPVKEVFSLLPDALRSKIPPVPNVEFFPSTESGSFRKTSEISYALNKSDIGLLIGDFSRNSETAVAIAQAIVDTEKPLILTRDTVDLVLNDAMEIVKKENLIFVCSMAQLQKFFRAIYYPKVILLSMPLLPVVEALHKFTITYKMTILTLHQGQILVAKDGNVVSTPLEKTKYSPLSMWSGELAAKIAAFNLFNPGKELEATAAAILD